MKVQRTSAFDSDYRSLTSVHQHAFPELIRTKFDPACDALAVNPSRKWPTSLRVKSVTGAPGVREMT